MKYFLSIFFQTNLYYLTVPKHKCLTTFLAAKSVNSRSYLLGPTHFPQSKCNLNHLLTMVLYVATSGNNEAYKY